jgi:hypothetical protein
MAKPPAEGSPRRTSARGATTYCPTSTSASPLPGREGLVREADGDRDDGDMQAADNSTAGEGPQARCSRFTRATRGAGAGGGGRAGERLRAAARGRRRAPRRRGLGGASAGGAYAAVATVRRSLAAGPPRRGMPADGSAPASRAACRGPSRPPGREAHRRMTRVQRPGRPSAAGARAVRRQVWPPGGPSRAPWRPRRPHRGRRRRCAS